MSAWADLDDARALWPDAAGLDDTLLDTLLSAALVICQRFAAPSIGVDPEAPRRRRRGRRQRATPRERVRGARAVGRLEA